MKQFSILLIIILFSSTLWSQGSTSSKPVNSCEGDSKDPNDAIGCENNSVSESQLRHNAFGQPIIGYSSPSPHDDRNDTPFSIKGRFKGGSSSDGSSSSGGDGTSQ